MKREELTKPFMMITNWKNPLISIFYKQIFLNCRLKGLSIVRTAAGALIQTSWRAAPNKLCFLSPQQYPCGGGGGGARVDGYPCRAIQDLLLTCPVSLWSETDWSLRNSPNPGVSGSTGPYSWGECVIVSHSTGVHTTQYTQPRVHTPHTHVYTPKTTFNLTEQNNWDCLGRLLGHGTLSRCWINTGHRLRYWPYWVHLIGPTVYNQIIGI